MKRKMLTLAIITFMAVIISPSYAQYPDNNAAKARQNLNETQKDSTSEYQKFISASEMKISDNEKEVGCIYFERLRSLNGKPVFYDITMLPNLNFPRFSALSLENKSLFDVLRTKYQIEVTGGVQQIFAIKADAKLQEHFRVKPGHPVLQLNRKLDTNKMGLYIYSQVFCITDELGLSGTF